MLGLLVGFLFYRHLHPTTVFAAAEPFPPGPSRNAIPTMIRYDSSGHETDRRHGGSPEDVLAWLKAGE